MPLEELDSDCEEFWSREEFKEYLSCAVLVVGRTGEVVVLDHFGPAIDWHVSHYSADAGELGLNHDNLDSGIYVWEGTMYSAKFPTPDGMEWDHVVEGEIRLPNENEWAAIKAGRCPWNKDTCPRKKS